MRLLFARITKKLDIVDLETLVSLCMTVGIIKWDGSWIKNGNFILISSISLSFCFDGSVYLHASKYHL
jgi:hypothetical protein